MILNYISEKNKTPSGFFYEKILKKFFNKVFYEALTNIELVVNDERGPVFMYSNLVEIGINILEQVLIHNGYLQYSQNIQNIGSNTICYHCGKKYSEHLKKY